MCGNSTWREQQQEIRYYFNNTFISNSKLNNNEMKNLNNENDIQYTLNNTYNTYNSPLDYNNLLLNKLNNIHSLYKE